MLTSRTKLFVVIARRKGDRSPLVWPVLVLACLLAEGAIITGVVLYCRAKGWM